jgi:hypothetical protein
MLIFGTHVEGDVEPVPDFWTSQRRPHGRPHELSKRGRPDTRRTRPANAPTTAPPCWHRSTAANPTLIRRTDRPR